MLRPDHCPPRAHEQLEQFAPGLRQYFRRRLGDATDVEDLTQEVFVRLLARQSHFQIENLAGYVFQVANNLLRERIRRTGRRSGVGAALLSAGLLEGDADFSAERVHEGRQACLQIERALQELPERVRNIFILNRFEELTGPQIAKRLGVSLSTVEKDMTRAILHLKDRLK